MTAATAPVKPSAPKSSSVEIYKAEGKSDVFLFDPDKLTLVTDVDSALYDDRVHLPFDEKLVRNIMHNGVHTPIIVTKNAETGNIEVVAGRRRVTSAREANRRLVEQGKEPLRVKGTIQRGDAGKLAGLMVSENEHRQQDTPLGRAKKAQKMLDMGLTEDDIANAFGCSSQTIRDGVMVLDSTADVQAAVEAGEITMGNAVALATQAPDVQREKVAAVKEINKVAKGHDKVRKVREVIEAPVVRLRGKKEIVKAGQRIAAAIQDDGVRTHLQALLAWMLGDDVVLDAMCEPGEFAAADKMVADADAKKLADEADAFASAEIAKCLDDNTETGTENSEAA